MDGKVGIVARIAASADAAVAKLTAEAASRLDGAGLRLYHGSYVDLVLAAESESGTVALVAGSHTQGFPYFTTEPWDNCLLLVGDAGYTFTGRSQGASLHLDFDVEQSTPTGKIRFEGEMQRASDGRLTEIRLDLPVSLVKFPTRMLGETYNFLEIDGAIGMRWRPYSLRAEGGELRVGGEEIGLSAVRGGCERGELTNLKAHDFAIKYDYFGLALAGVEGYGIINFTSHALFDDTLLGNAIDIYLTKSARAFLTIEGGGFVDGNPRGVVCPPPDNSSVVLFENEVDLGLAMLKRQMIRTHDHAGHALHGLREIFIAKPRE